MSRRKQPPQQPRDSMAHRPPDPSATRPHSPGQREPLDTSSSEQKVLESPGKPMDADVRTLMESRLGHDFSQIRVHTDHEASESARAMGARAYAAGFHLVFLEGAYSPGSHDGQRLLAHELTHSIQQRGNAGHLRTASPTAGSNDRAEQEARSVAHNFFERPAFSITPGSLHQIGRDDLSPLEWAVQEVHKTLRRDFVQEMLEEILTPALHRDSLIDRVNTYTPAMLALVVQPLGQRDLENIAGSDAGMAILNSMLVKLNGKPEAETITKALDARSNSATSIPVAKARPEDIKALERMNQVIPKDPRFHEYAKADVALKFPVQLYSAGRAVDGGVYYDPNLGLAGLVSVRGRRVGMRGKITRTQYPLLFVQLGPDALAGSDANLQAVMWHEFTHYRRALEFRKPDNDKSHAVKLLEAAVTPEGTKQDPDSETEATSVALAVYHPILTDKEVTSHLLYLARFIKESHAPFKPEAIKRIREAVDKNPAQRIRLIRLLNAITDETRRKNLSDLKSALMK